MASHLGRFEGRLFAEDGCLFLVVHADEARDLARVTCRVDDSRQLMEMPLTEVVRRIHSSPGLMLDNLNGAASRRRIFHRGDGWHFSAREGAMGPYRSREDAGRALVRHVLRMQEHGATPRPPMRNATSRRDGDARRQRGAAADARGRAPA